MNQKKRQPLNRTASLQMKARNETSGNHATDSSYLTQYQIDKLLDNLPIRANQAKRFVSHLARNPKSKTADCNIAVGAVNLSDIATKYNPYLESSGFKLECELPYPLIKNLWNEETMQHLWSLRPVADNRRGCDV